MRMGVFVRVDNREIWFKFKEFVMKKHHKLHGALGSELTKALEYYLQKEEEGTARTHTNNTNNYSNYHNYYKNNNPNDDMNTYNSSNGNNGNNKTMQNLKMIINQILDETEKQIPQTRVERIITINAGGDKRTINKYVSYLTDFGVLKPTHRLPTLNPKEIKFMFEVDLDEAKKFIGLHM